ncbi:pyridoxal phosphate-dependent transferase [Dactylonectria estremocensis]|uniref:Pyridoxal phosphate-dependent transferase n=1 Tax=Dactylonectria estremocensis TaxID=1079267 RepID=A0A9P9E2D2_9HYPO|nr:pyridoxal phosphate-dependent transferase [Dactylonectria estremocensis]
MRLPSPSADPYRPSRRALETFNSGKSRDLMSQAGQRPTYDPDCRPNGLINLSGAVNILMRDWLEEYTDQAMKDIAVSKTLPYGTISGGPKLCSAMAGFFNRFFQPDCPVEPAQIMATNGVTAMIDLVAWTLCEPGDAVLYLAPTFDMLDYDLASRNGIVGVSVSTTGLDEPFGGDDKDIRRCYSSNALTALVRFCASGHMHLVADEISALSRFSDEPFCSVLSVQGTNVDGKQRVHSIYGLSKDFDMGGVRMGFLVTRNTAWFTWITGFSEVFVANFFSQLDLVQEYASLYQQRISAAYSRTHEALIINSIPFQPATSGLFVSVDLGWVRCFDGPNQADDADETHGGVFLNPGQSVLMRCPSFAYCDRPGHFRLVFTEVPIGDVVLAIERLRLSLDKVDAGMGMRRQMVLKQRHVLFPFLDAKFIQLPVEIGS